MRGPSCSAGSSSADRTAARPRPRSRASAAGVRLGRLGPQAADAARRVDQGRLPGRVEAADHVGPGEDARHQHQPLAAEYRGRARPSSRSMVSGPPSQPSRGPARRAAARDPLGQPPRVEGHVGLQQGAQPGPVGLDEALPGVAPAGPPAPARCAPGSASIARPERGLRGARGVRERPVAMSVARGLGVRGPDGRDLLLERGRRARCGGGMRQSGVCPRCGISSHSGAQIQRVRRARRTRRSQGVVALPLGALQGADRLLGLPEGGHARNGTGAGRPRRSGGGTAWRGLPLGRGSLVVHRVRQAAPCPSNDPATAAAVTPAGRTSAREPDGRQAAPDRPGPCPRIGAPERRAGTAPSSPYGSSVPSSPPTRSPCSASSSARSP